MILFFLFLALAIGVEIQKNNNSKTGQNSVENNSKVEAWQEAYYQYLVDNYSKTEYPTTFALVYLDGDHIPEIIVGYHGTGRFEKVSVFTFFDDKVCYLGDVGSYSCFVYLERRNFIKDTWVSWPFEEGEVRVLSIVEGEFIGKLYETASEKNKVNSYFMGDDLRRTPILMDGDPAFHCKKDELNLIRTNPDEVTVSVPVK